MKNYNDLPMNVEFINDISIRDKVCEVSGEFMIMTETAVKF